MMFEGWKEKKRKEKKERNGKKRRKEGETGQSTRARHVRVSVDWWNGSNAYACSARTCAWQGRESTRMRKVRVHVPWGTNLAHFTHNSWVNVWEVEKFNPRVRVQGASAWMVLYFSKFFYVFTPNQAFQTSKQLPKHHKTLFNLLDSQLNFN